jgi:hypothetical protein
LHLGYHGNGCHFEFFQPPQKLPHTTVDIPTKFDERNPKKNLIPPQTTFGIFKMAAVAMEMAKMLKN